MHIIWYGQTFFHIIASRGKGEQTSIVTDPLSPNLGLKVPNPTADILLLSSKSDPEIGRGVRKPLERETFLVEGPGEYEIKEVEIQGIESQGISGKPGENTIYTIEAEEIKICHLGKLSQKELTSEQLEKIGDVDILIIPVGDGRVLESKKAADIVSQIEPHIVIPMCYHLPKLKIKLESAEKFLKEIGQKSAVPQPKLLIKKKDLPSDGPKAIVLKP
jgi:L-ascorbate metabolism protein UlaG (beta-lactamase superfamily)